MFINTIFIVFDIHMSIHLYKVLMTKVFYLIYFFLYFPYYLLKNIRVNYFFKVKKHGAYESISNEKSPKDIKDIKVTKYVFIHFVCSF